MSVSPVTTTQQLALLKQYHAQQQFRALQQTQPASAPAQTAGTTTTTTKSPPVGQQQGAGAGSSNNPESAESIQRRLKHVFSLVPEENHQALKNFFILKEHFRILNLLGQPSIDRVCGAAGQAEDKPSEWWSRGVGWRSDGRVC
jgi:hypothetical protein